MNRKKVIEKVMKLMALGKSSNPNEAALAMERAKKMMDKHGISASEFVIAEIQESEGNGVKAETPAFYVSHLANVVASMFQCDFFWRTTTKRVWSNYRGEGVNKYTSKPVFVGMHPNEELCSYCFNILFRQLSKQRREYKAYGDKATKTRKKDSYALGWVEGVRRNISHIIPPEPEIEISSETGLIKVNPLKEYIKETVNGTMNSRDIEPDKAAQFMGYMDGRSVNVNKPMAGPERTRIE